MTGQRFTAMEKFEEAKRELGMRQWVFAARVEAGKMKRADAERKIAIMEDIARDYEYLAKLGERE